MVTRFRSREKSGGYGMLLPFAIIAVILIIIPLALIIIKSIAPAPGYSFSDNWNYIGMFIWEKILYSFWIALATTAICIVISYPFAYFLSVSKNKVYKTAVVFIVTAPIWTSFLVKLIGLKTFFDLINGYQNSTYGSIWTIIGLVYVFIPFMILPLFSVLDDMPKNIVWASLDLGRTQVQTFMRVVLPYTKTALISGITLVFLPSLTTVAVPQFLNNSPDGSMICDIIVQEGSLAPVSAISLARASSLSLLLSILMVGGYVLMLLSTKGIGKIIRKRREYA